MSYNTGEWFNAPSHTVSWGCPVIASSVSIKRSEILDPTQCLAWYESRGGADTFEFVLTAYSSTIFPLTFLVVSHRSVSNIHVPHYHCSPAPFVLRSPSLSSANLQSPIFWIAGWSAPLLRLHADLSHNSLLEWSRWPPIPMTTISLWISPRNQVLLSLRPLLSPECLLEMPPLSCHPAIFCLSTFLRSLWSPLTLSIQVSFSWRCDIVGTDGSLPCSGSNLGS